MEQVFDLETGGDPCVPGRPDLKLKTYRVEVEDGKVVVYLTSMRYPTTSGTPPWWTAAPGLWLSGG